MRKHLHSRRIKGFSDGIDGFIGQFGNFNAINNASDCHQVSGIVFEINGSVRIDDRAANRILSLRPVGSEQNGSTIVCCALIFLLHDGGRFGLTGSVCNDAKHTGSEVIKEIDVNSVVITCICSGKDAACLRITFCAYRICNAHAFKINNRDVVSGVCAELGCSGNTDIGPAVVNRRSAGTHGGV